MEYCQNLEKLNCQNGVLKILVIADREMYSHCSNFGEDLEVVCPEFIRSEIKEKIKLLIKRRNKKCRASRLCIPHSHITINNHPLWSFQDDLQPITIERYIKKFNCAIAS